MPKSRGQLLKMFLEERYNPEDKSHIKCFACELLTSIPILVLFGNIVLQPPGKLLQHCLCLGYMADILGILTHHDAVELAPKLQVITEAHNQLFVDLCSNCTNPNIIGYITPSTFKSSR